MEIEELFCKRYPEYSVNGKPLHPYFDVFEEGYEQAEKENAEPKDQLTKAKEIIKEFVLWANWEGANCPNFKDIQSKAEQFLKEIEKCQSQKQH